MDLIKRVGLIICILMVMMAYLKQAIPRGKIASIMKTIISVFILISVVDGIRSIDFERLKSFAEQPYSVVGEDTYSKIEEGLIVEFNSFLEEQKIEAYVSEIVIDDDTEIKYVLILGSDKGLAKKLLVARYRINAENIEVKNE